ncbi:hypothetical protein [Teredinibacter turnerae]|uniref:hypothetical protein n=1 Tax=Teredinibacter turnerae TaxID=2426 RepID=UPI000362A29B|nr:hypothetical protein [Teredinibacter turnerae]
MSKLIVESFENGAGSVSKTLESLVKNSEQMLPVDSDTDRKYEMIAGVLRQDAVNPGVWGFIEDSDHKPMMHSQVSVQVVGSSTVRVNYGKAYSRIISLVVTPDETLSKKGVYCGASVGKSSCSIEVAQSIEMGGEVRYDGSDWVSLETPDASKNIRSTSVTGSAAKFEHDYCPGVALTVSPSNSDGAVVSPFLPVVRSVNATNFYMDFLSVSSNTYQSVLSQNMCFRVQKNYVGPVPVNTYDAGLNEGNIWLYGVFEV